MAEDARNVAVAFGVNAGCRLRLLPRAVKVRPPVEDSESAAKTAVAASRLQTALRAFHLMTSLSGPHTSLRASNSELNLSLPRRFHASAFTRWAKLAVGENHCAAAQAAA